MAEVGRLFLRLGLTAFGGPAAHVALFRDEFVRRRRWLDDRDFLDLLAAANVIPGPTSTELAMHLGHRRAGWPGLAVAGLAFLGPAAVLVGLVAWGYVELGALPEVGGALAGIAPVVVAIVAHATGVLGRAAVTGPAMAIVAAGALVASTAGVAPLAVLAAGAAAGLAARAQGDGTRAGRAPTAVLATLALPGTGSIGAALAVGTGIGLGGLFVVFLKIGALLFGSGYLLIALLDSELVSGAGVITERQLLDAVAVGQFTPGPVITAATFVGYLLLGLPGAVVATVAVAIPAFAAVAASVPVLHRLRDSPRPRAALDGVAAAVVGALIAVTVDLASTALVDPLTGVLAAGALVALSVTAINPAVLIAAGAVAGLAASFVAGG